MKFHGFKHNKRAIAKEKDDATEELRTDLEIIRQALDALDEADRRFTADFAAWRADWRAKLGTLDITSAKDAVFAKWTDPERTAIDLDFGADTMEENLPDLGTLKANHIQDYQAYLDVHESPAVQVSESQSSPQHD